ncbi:HAD family hydrolase [Brachybacterium alimentarium]|nr:HAD family hydrolase [Brachybacterium alimentarium]
MVMPMNDVPHFAGERARSAAEHHRAAAALLRGADAVILDFNGTLSLDEDLLERCYAAALDNLGLQPMGSAEYATLLGRSEHDIAQALLENRAPVSDATQKPTRAVRLPESNDGEDRRAIGTSAVLTEVSRLYVEECGRHPRIPESHLRLVHRLHRLGIPLAIATGTLREMIDPVLSQAGLKEIVPVVVTVEDVTRGKPDPEAFLQAALLLGADITRAVIVEDSRAGVTAAHAAGAAAIGVGPGAHGAEVAIDHLGQLTNLI